MFVVAGATGNTGGATAASLLAAGVPVRVLLRDPGQAALWKARGAEVAVGDNADASALARAFRGAEAVYVLNPPAYTLPDLFDRARRVAEAILKAAQRTRPKRLVVLSSIGAHLAFGTGIILTNRAFEQILGDAPCPVTFLRPAYFLENWKLAASVAGRDGVLPSFLAPLGRAIPMVGAADIGRTAAAAMRDPSPPRLIELAGPRDYSPRDAAAAFTATLGRRVTPFEIPVSEWPSVLSPYGFSARTIEAWRELFLGFNSGRVSFEHTSTVQRGVTGLEEAATAMRLIASPGEKPLTRASGSNRDGG